MEEEEEEGGGAGAGGGRLANIVLIRRKKNLESTKYNKRYTNSRYSRREEHTRDYIVKTANGRRVRRRKASKYSDYEKKMTRLTDTRMLNTVEGRNIQQTT